MRLSAADGGGPAKAATLACLKSPFFVCGTHQLCSAGAWKPCAARAVCKHCGADGHGWSSTSDATCNSDLQDSTIPCSVSCAARVRLLTFCRDEARKKQQSGKNGPTVHGFRGVLESCEGRIFGVMTQQDDPLYTDLDEMVLMPCEKKKTGSVSVSPGRGVHLLSFLSCTRHSASQGPWGPPCSA